MRKKNPKTNEESAVETVPLSTLLGDNEEGQLTIDVFETPREFVIKSAVAGVKPEDLDISIDDDIVTIRGERTHDEKVTEENYLYRECFWGNFSRTVILPSQIDPDRAQAGMKNGILTIRLPKTDEPKTKKVGVEEEGTS